MGIESAFDIVKRNQLKWLVHVLWEDDVDWVMKCILYEVKDVSGRVRLRVTWSQVVERDMRECGWEDAQECM